MEQTLDPAIAQLLAMMAANPTPPIAEQTPEMGRMAFRMIAQLADVKDVQIAEVKDIHIPGPAGQIPARLYRPVAGGILPVMVYYHGGGFVIGDLETHDGLCRALALESGAAVVAVDYRLAPEHRFPAAVDDAFAAAKWVAAHAASLGLDAGRLAVGGDSAGANLAAVVAQLARDQGGPAIKFQLLFCPVVDALCDTGSRREFAKGYFLEQETMNWFMGHYLPPGTDPDDPRLSPLKAKDLSRLPAARIVTAGFDPLRDEGRAYARALAAAGGTVEDICVPGAIHHFYGLGAMVPVGRTAISDAAASLKKHLG